MHVSKLLAGYDTEDLTIGVLGGHSALDVCHGAKQAGFQTVCIARKGRERTYAKHYASRPSGNGTVGCVDECIVVDQFEDVLQEDIQKKLRDMNTIFVHNRYFWVYFNDFDRVEKDFHVPIFGNRSYVKLEERDQPYNQYHLLTDAGIRTPKIYDRPETIDRPVIVKASEKTRGYERAFFVVATPEEWEREGRRLEMEGKVDPRWRDATIEEFVVGAAVNFNFFFSPLTGELEFMGTDTRRQTNLDGFLHMTTDQQITALKHVDLKMIETGHIAVTIKESLIEKAFELGEKFVQATKDYEKFRGKDSDAPGIIGPFALQGSVIAEDGKEDIVIFDVSLRIPGSPGIISTPYSGYLLGENLSYGGRIGMELRMAQEENRLHEILT